MGDVLMITKEKSEDRVIINLFGEVDIYSAPDLKKQLYDIVQQEKNNIEINCENLNYIDSTGLGILVGILKKVKEYGKDVYITKLKGNIKKLFLITGLDKVFNMEE